MKQIRKKNLNLVHIFMQLTWTLVLALLMPAARLAFTPVTIVFPVRQAFTTASGLTYTTTDEVEYLLTAADTNTPLPSGSNDGQYRITLNGNQLKDTGAITFLSAGIYKYTMTQVIPANFNYQWTDQTFHLTVYVKNDASYMITITNNENLKVSEMSWGYTWQRTNHSDSGDSDDSGDSGSITGPAPVVPGADPLPENSWESSGKDVLDLIEILLAPVSLGAMFEDAIDHVDGSLGGVLNGLAGTGDTGNLSLLVIIAAVSFLGLLITGGIRLRSRRHKKKNQQKNYESAD